MTDQLIPPWVDAIVVRLIKTYVPSSAIAAAFAEVKAKAIEQAKALAADTANKWDDAAVAKVEEILNGCSPDSQFLCDLIKNGEQAVVDLLRAGAQQTPTQIDDALVDLLADALKQA